MVSPPSTRPPGSDHRPWCGGCPRSTSSSRPARSRATSPTATTGRPGGRSEGGGTGEREPVDGQGGSAGGAVAVLGGHLGLGADGSDRGEGVQDRLGEAQVADGAGDLA